MDNINPEFLGNVIDVFDDFLEEHNIRIPESDKEMESDGYDPDDSTRLYGAVYDELLQKLSELITHVGEKTHGFNREDDSPPLYSCR